MVDRKRVMIKQRCDVMQYFEFVSFQAAAVRVSSLAFLALEEERRRGGEKTYGMTGVDSKMVSVC